MPRDIKGFRQSAHVKSGRSLGGHGLRFKGYNRSVLSCCFSSALAEGMGQISHDRENKRRLQTDGLFALFVRHRCWEVTPQLGAISAVTEVMQALHALFLACYISTFSSDSRASGCAGLGTQAQLSLECGTEQLCAACRIWLLGQFFPLAKSFSTII